MKLRDEGLQWKRLDDQVVVLDLQTSQYLSLNGTGAELWEALAEGADEDALVARLRGEYEVDESTAREDVEEFLGQLTELGLLA